VTSRYQERPVSPALARRVVCTWVDPGRNERHAVLPDACIDLVWDGASLVVAGPDTQAWRVTGEATFVGIRFKPGSAPGYLGVPASELLNQTLPLRDVVGSALAPLTEALAERLALAGSSWAAADVLEDFVLHRHASASPVDDVVEHAVHELRRASRRPVVQTLADRFGLSERSLHRRCTIALGYGPKTLDRILRFRRALRLASSTGNGLADVACSAGYADQAHLSNECRRLAGATPSELMHGTQVVLSANGS
jgi:AraC-like DNA-binding protein